MRNFPKFLQIFQCFLSVVLSCTIISALGQAAEGLVKGANRDFEQNFSTNLNSFIIAFKSRQDRELRFKNFADETRYYHSIFSKSEHLTQAPPKLQFITHLDLAFGNSGSFWGMLPKNLFWKFGRLNTEKPSALVLAKADFGSIQQGEAFCKEGILNGDIGFCERDNFQIFSPIPVMRHASENKEQSPFWWVNKLHLQEALLKLTDFHTNPPLIAIFDSGVDISHPGLEGRVWKNPYQGELGCGKEDVFGCDTTQLSLGQLGKGSVQPYLTSSYGENCPLISSNPENANSAKYPDPSCLHGTQVAGVLVGRLEERIGGVCPICKIIVIKVVKNLNGTSGVSDSSLLAGLKYVSLLQKKQGEPVRIINASFGKFHKSHAVSLMLEQMQSEGKGILFVAAAGNEDSMRRVYPAANKGTVAVSALDFRGRKASYSNFGPWVDIASYGGESSHGARGVVFSATPGGGRSGTAGTSIATPMVSAVAGLILSKHPHLSSEQLKIYLLAAVNPEIYQPEFAEGFNYRYYYPKIGNKKIPLLGKGVVDGGRALSLRFASDSPVTKKRENTSHKCGVALAYNVETENDPAPKSIFWILWFLPLVFLLVL